MPLRRPITLFLLTVGLAVLLGETTTIADDTPAKVEKKNKKKPLPPEAPAKPAESKPADTAPAPAKPAPSLALPVNAKDAAALAKLIDEQVRVKLDEAKFPPSPLCTDEEFVRRAYLDLTGVIPTADKARAFLDSTDPKKREKLIDELLDSPNFGRHLADVWQAKLMPRGSDNRFVLREPFVKWLDEQFNKNTPWNVLVTSIVTASGDVEQNPATTYFLSNRSVDKLTDSVAVNFLGVQLQCAQCHNHPFTEWKQAEYWGMAEFFAKVRPDNPKNANKGGDNTKIGVTEGPGRTKAKDFFPESAKTVSAKFLGGPEPKLSAAEPYRPVLAKWLTAADNPFFARAMVNRTWALLFGAGFVNPIDDMHDGNFASHPVLLATLAKAFAEGGFDLKNLYRAMCLSQTYQRGSKATKGNEKDDHLFSHQTMKVLSPEQLFDSLASVTGAAAADKVRPGQAGKGAPTGPRDQFVQFFLAGADAFNPVEYEAGIPQALRLMNARVTSNPGMLRQFVSPGDKPAAVFEKMYLATLSRRPTPAEVTRLTAYMGKASSPVEGYGDILWAVLNSSEFSMVK